MSKYNKTIRVGVNINNLVYPIDPINNPTLTNAFFSNNMYSNLVEVDEENKFALELASKYWFDDQNKKLFFEFKGSRINALDAEFSLRRLVHQAKHLHSDFWKIICLSGESADLCSNRIYVENDKLVIKYADAKKASYIIPTLASVDYKIIPISAFDSDDYRIAKITDYTKTSGYYFLDKANDTFFLKRNSQIKIDDIYEKFEVVNVDTRSIEREIESDYLKSIDVLSTTVVLLGSSYDRLASLGWNIFNTHQINIGMLVYTKRGIEKTTSKNRFQISKKIFSHATKLVSYPNSKFTHEFFQDFGQGFLDKMQKNEIENMRNKDIEEAHQTIKFGLLYPDRWQTFVIQNPSIEVIKSDKFVPFLPYSEQPDIYVTTNDVSFDLNLSLISYAANTGLLDMSKEELNQFTDIVDEQEKIKFINAIHFRTLKNCQIYPMWASPYTTAFNGEFKHNLSKFNSRTLLWKIH